MQRSIRFPLRTILLADAAISGLSGLVMIVLASPLADLLELPTALLRVSGLILIPYVGALIYVATRKEIPVRGVWAVIATNLLWTAGSVVTLFSGEIDANAGGILVIVVQAVAVALIAELEVLALHGHQQSGRTSLAA
ncbi:MAG TPA: hypothetical protein VFQ54_06625 [Thermomicrobiales bacterium]|nr:hypothetical protein [Thermomicrobiales bacterium]